jgi:hypothetical protein
MAWRIKGRYVASCTCRNVCPCSTASAPPDNPDGSTLCHGVLVSEITEGNMDGVDLSGVRWGLFNEFPTLVTDGQWKVGLFVDSAANDQQAKALEDIASGQHGGPFGDMAPLVAEFLGVERVPITVGQADGALGPARFTYAPLRGVDGNPTTMKNASFGFAPEFEIGTSAGRVEVFGYSFEASYGETADIDWGSETTDVHGRA